MITPSPQPLIRYATAGDALVPRDHEPFPNDSSVSIWSDAGSSTTAVQFPLERRWRGFAILEPAP